MWSCFKKKISEGLLKKLLKKYKKSRQYILEITIKWISTRAPGRISNWTFGESSDFTTGRVLKGIFAVFPDANVEEFPKETSGEISNDTLRGFLHGTPGGIEN